MKRLHPSGPDMEQPKRMNWIGDIEYLTFVDTDFKYVKPKSQGMMRILTNTRVWNCRICLLKCRLSSIAVR